MTDPLARSIADRLLMGSLEGAIVIALVAAICWRFTTIAPAARAALWWLASLNLVLALLPVPGVTLPILPAVGTHGEVTRDVDRIVDTTPASAEPTITGGHSGVAAASAPEARRRASPEPWRRREARPYRSSASRGVPDWYQVAVLVWFAAVAAQAAVLLQRFRRIRALVGRAVPCSTAVAANAAHIAHAIGLRRLPDVRTSTEVGAPQVTGLWHPTVLLPAGDFTSEERTMMLGHELMHIRRRDLALGWVPAAAERLFFFHPLARVAAREYVTARESACDVAAVRALGVAPADYGRLLIRFGVGAPEPTLTAGGSPMSRSSLKRRLEMLPDAPIARASRRASWIAAGVVAALVPLQLAARAPQSPAPAPPAPPAPSTAARPVVVARPVAQEPAPAASEPARAVVAEPRSSGIESTRRVVERRSQQQVEPRAVQRQSEEATRVIRERQEAAEQRRVEQETALRELTEQYRRQLDEMRAAVDEQAARVSIEQLAQETRRRRDEAVRQDATAEMLSKQIEELTQLQRVLREQLQQVLRQQSELSVAQRELAATAERIRKQLEAAK